MPEETMREAFERTNVRDHRRQPPKGNNYIDPMAQADWESFQKGWNQSREALVIELPEAYATDSDGFWMLYRKDVRAAIEAAGLKVTP
ncbi:hypothetical protein HU742_014410 [Pseudomonas sp. SWRI102]|uniref:Uncharacterized protein n=1 Tax=Pseudomonas marvdashtae TaxID=2745500 RepID=A0A923FNP2_9PSED|nr:hypothetical protein [Pseudomonas marvdashtae]MBV4552335.1 hypothetical protein [Pseudomonas marvdashtae]